MGNDNPPLMQLGLGRVSYEGDARTTSRGNRALLEPFRARFLPLYTVTISLVHMCLMMKNWGENIYTVSTRSK